MNTIFKIEILQRRNSNPDRNYICRAEFLKPKYLEFEKGRQRLDQPQPYPNNDFSFTLILNEVIV